MQPINYMPQNQTSFLQDFASAFQVGAGIRQIQQQQEQQKLAQQQQEQYKIDLQSAMQNPTAEAFGKLALKYPGQREAIISSGKLITDAQQTSAFNDASKIFSALELKNNAAALKIATIKRDALKNAGRETEDYDSIIEAINTNPIAAKATVGLIGASIDPKKWTETFKAAPEVEEAKSKAAKATIDAKFAESNAAIDLKKKGWDITKIQEDIKIAKENSRIAALSAQIAREGNALKRDEMRIKLQELKDKRDESIRGKTYEAETQLGQIDNLLNSVDGILSKSVIKDKTGKVVDYTSTIKSATGPISSQLPTLSSDVADLEEAVETIKSQVTMSRIGEMKGALSDKDLKTLQDSLQALSLRQSPQQLVSNLREVQRLTTKARDNTIKRYGIPVGSPARVPDTPQSAPEQSEIDAILKKYGG